MNNQAVRRRAGPTDTLALDEVSIGKDILELVSVAMYVEPLTIYREYIQNAADAVDAARETGLIGPDERGRVEVVFEKDPKVRSVRIRDNGFHFFQSVLRGVRIVAFR